MDYTVVTLPESRIVGPVVRTANDAPDCGQKIGELWQKFMGEGMAQSVPDAILDPYLTYGLYYDYSMEDQSYAVMAGTESTSNAIPENMEEIIIPAGTYAKFTVHGDCVNTVAQAWVDIWAMEELTKKRIWTVDFEAYPPTEDPNDTDIDFYIAIQ